MLAENMILLRNMKGMSQEQGYYTGTACRKDKSFRPNGF